MGEEQKNKKLAHYFGSGRFQCWVPNYGPEPTQLSACFHAKNSLGISQGDTRDDSRYVT